MRSQPVRATRPARRVVIGARRLDWSQGRWRIYHSRFWASSLRAFRRPPDSLLDVRCVILPINVLTP